MFILAAPTPGFLKMKKKSLLLKKPLTHKVLLKKMYFNTNATMDLITGKLYLNV